MSETYTQRMRVTYATDDTVKYVGHLDMARAWERAIRRARLPLAYSQGFHPQPRIQFAAALPVGFTGRAEVVDVYLNEELAPDDFLEELAAALPSGIQPTHAVPVPRKAPSLQSQVCGAAYRVEVETDELDGAFLARLERFMAQPEVWRARHRGKKAPKRYDLRPLVQSLSYLGETDYGQAFEVVMQSQPGATGRPDELLAELGYEKTPRRIARLELVFSA